MRLQAVSSSCAPALDLLGGSAQLPRKQDEDLLRGSEVPLADLRVSILKMCSRSNMGHLPAGAPTQQGRSSRCHRENSLENQPEDRGCWEPPRGGVQREGGDGGRGVAGGKRRKPVAWLHVCTWYTETVAVGSPRRTIHLRPPGGAGGADGTFSEQTR